MPEIIPFRAVRPIPDKVSLIASRSYESYTPQERRIQMEANPLSFLHIINPGYKRHKSISGEKRYYRVRHRYDEFKSNGYLIKDSRPCYYLHKIINRENQVFHGIVGAASVADYRSNKIKRHEETLSKRVNTFKEYLDITRFNAEPVLLTYPDNPVINGIFLQITAHRAEYEFTTTSGDTHCLWVVDNPEHQRIITAEFAGMEKMYIADGHHRTAASAALAEADSQSKDPILREGPSQYFMVFSIPESELQIHEFNRLIKDLNGLEKEEFLIKLNNYYHINNRGNAYYGPRHQKHFSMYLDGEFYALRLRKHKYQFLNALSKLDVKILYDTILNPILGITNLRHHERIHYIQGKKGMPQVKKLIDQGEYAVGFGLLPTTLEEVKRIVNEGLIVPPKTTYIKPKLQSAVTIYEI